MLAGKRFSSHARRMDKIKTTTQSSQVEACQKLLSSLDMNGSDNNMWKMMDMLNVGDEKRMEHEDLSYWDELEILNQDDFSSPEEQVSLDLGNGRTSVRSCSGFRTVLGFYTMYLVAF